VHPDVAMGVTIKIGDKLGTCQDLDRRYAKISNHWHFEILGLDSKPIDPTAVILLSE
jgi:hypothetical protein